MTYGRDAVVRDLTISDTKVVVWRLWRVAPERAAQDRVVPMLTGLLGFPWRHRELDAKCTVQVDAHDSLGRRLIDRHHRVVPDPGCTCGIYANRRQPAGPPSFLIPRGEPLVAGFVEFSGRIIEQRNVIRAQHATVVGPLTLLPPIPTRLSRLRRDGERMLTERNRFRLGRRGGLSLWEWNIVASELLGDRYAVEIVS